MSAVFVQPAMAGRVCVPAMQVPGIVDNRPGFVSLRQLRSSGVCYRRKYLPWDSETIGSLV